MSSDTTNSPSEGHTTTSATATTAATEVDISQLLSTCIDACRRGCEVIRNVRHKSLHGSSDILESVLYKIADDPRSALTEADGASQKVIIECLQQVYEKEIECGLIKIVGEEEDDHSTDLEGDKSFDTAYSEDILSHFDNYNCPRPDVEPIVQHMFDNTDEQQQSADTEHSAEKKKVIGKKGDEIIIFIDPMDGTREFVEGRIQNVQCLIGITLNGKPVAGAMGIPMMHTSKIEIAYGMISSSLAKKEDDGDEKEEVVVPILSGVKFFDALNPMDEKVDCGTISNDNDDDGTLLIFSGDSKKPALSLAMVCLENRVLGGQTDSDMNPPTRKVVAGGCGNKMLSVQRHFQCMSERHASSSSDVPLVGSISVAPPGSSSWDTAAPTAVLLAADPKARVTDLIGQPLIYDGDNLLNKCGVVVSSGCIATKIHDRLCKDLSENEALRDVIVTKPKEDDIVEIPKDIGEAR